jgi:hypothetical protein
LDLTVLASGSSGNSYILKSSNGKFIVLDCGLKFKSITNNASFNGFKNLDFVFVSHNHKDHSNSEKDFENSGCEMITYDNIKSYEVKEIGQWKIQCFPAKHNALNYGIIIYDNIDKKLFCYATDFSEIPLIKNIDYWLYEINYSTEIAETQLLNGQIEMSHIQNTFAYHNSLENAIKYFSKNSKPNTIIACHINNMQGLEKEILTKMKSLAENVYVAKKNTIINLKEKGE